MEFFYCDFCKGEFLLQKRVFDIFKNVCLSKMVVSDYYLKVIIIQDSGELDVKLLIYTFLATV